MHRDGKWAKQLIELQDAEGKWGAFHSMAQASGASFTTEQALRRLERLGFTMEDECIRRAVSYMEDCLIGKKQIPDPKEKSHDWDVFTALILSTWIRRFTRDNPHANRTAERWAGVITAAFHDGMYNPEAYDAAYRDILKPNGGFFVGFEKFYPVSLVCGCLDEQTEEAVLRHLINGEGGIYYVYEGRLSVLPETFESREASRYLAAIELLAGYKQAKNHLGFVVDWLMDHRKENGCWDMGKAVNDKLYFPLSDDWRKGETREADCTERISKLIKKLSDETV